MRGNKEKSSNNNNKNNNNLYYANTCKTSRMSKTEFDFSLKEKKLSTTKNRNVIPTSITRNTAMYLVQCNCSIRCTLKRAGGLIIKNCHPQCEKVHITN